MTQRQAKRMAHLFASGAIALADPLKCASSADQKRFDKALAELAAYHDKFGNKSQPPNPDQLTLEGEW